MFERPKTILALDRAAIETGRNDDILVFKVEPVEEARDYVSDS
jgi:hypothetical protein